jgi:hypothetical protein
MVLVYALNFGNQRGINFRCMNPMTFAMGNQPIRIIVFTAGL